jgi:hypothetical protein
MGYLIYPLLFHKNNQLKFIMPKIAIVAYKFGPKAKPLRRTKLENGQATYQILESIQVRRWANQIYEDPSWVTVPISKPQIMYIRLIITTQANIFMG